MNTPATYEKFPLRTVLISNLAALLIYGLGFAILIRTGLYFALIYLLYVLLLELRLIKNHCTGCYYHGRICGFGKGRISAWFFKKKNPAEFCNKSFTWKDMIPDILISLVPLVTGIVLLILKFDIIVLSEMLIIVFLTTSGNGYVRGKLTCRFCKQRELGCPAAALFKMDQ